MKVAMLVHDFPKLSESFILNQITGLIDRGVEVDIYTDTPGDWLRVHPDVNRYRLWEHTYQLENIPQNYLWRVMKGLGLAVSHLFTSPLQVLRSLNWIAYGEQALNLWLLYTAVSLRAKPYDIVHCQFGTQAYRGLAVKRLVQPTPKLLIMFRGYDISGYLRQGGAALYRKLRPHADYALANCDFFRQKVLQLGWTADRVAVHFSGLDVRKFQYRPRSLKPGEPVRIATTGRLVEKKGLAYAIRAVVKQAKHTPNLEFLIIGDGPLKAELQELTRALQAEAYIQFLGWRNEAEIAGVLDTCHLFVAPSVAAANGDQDAPVNVLKEAMAMGLPVISTVHGGIPELVQDGVSGFLVPERDAEAIAERLDYLIAHPDRWSEMGQAGRAFVAEVFDLHRLNDRLFDLYSQLASPGELAAYPCPQTTVGFTGGTP